MTIYSWNMFFKNREQDRALDFIARSDFDVLCLQEVPDDFLEKLRALPYELTAVLERSLGIRGKDVANHLVILSRFPIKATGEIAADAFKLGWRANLFVRLMPSFYPIARDTAGHYADLEVPGREGPVRVYNLHLALYGTPGRRLEEFEAAMAGRAGLPAVVCGDFNIIESPRVSLLNWIFGGRVRDAALYNRERTRIETRFVEHELVNALAGGVTHPLSQSQLDHILVSRSFSVVDAAVLPDRIGSDHYPIRARVA